MVKSTLARSRVAADTPPGGALRSHFSLEGGAGALVLLLALAAMLLFMMIAIAVRVDALFESPNSAVLKLSADLHYFDAHRAPNEAAMPPGLFSDVVEFLPATPRSSWTMRAGCPLLNI